MKRDLLKRAMVMVLVMLVATAGLPMDAFAEEYVNEDNEIKETELVDVQFYDIDLPNLKDAVKWEALVLDRTPIDSNAHYERAANHGTDNWSKEEGNDAFLQQTSGQPSTENAQRISGYFTVKVDSYFRIKSDDGVEFTATSLLNPRDIYKKSAWFVKANNKLETDLIPAGDYSFVLDYYNWGGDGKLIVQISTDQSAWTEVESDMFYLKRTVPSLNPVIVNTDVELNDELTFTHNDLGVNWTYSHKWMKVKDSTEVELGSDATYTLLADDIGSEIFVRTTLQYKGEEVSNTIEESNKVLFNYEVPELNVRFELTESVINQSRNVSLINRVVDSSSFTSTSAGNLFTVLHDDLPEDYTIEYRWVLNNFDLSDETWKTATLDDSTKSITIPEYFGNQIGVEAVLMYKDVEVASYDSGYVGINNLYITADDYHELYINGNLYSKGIASTNPENSMYTHDETWVSVDTYYLSPEEHQELPLFAVKAWDGNNGAQVISGYRMAYFGPNNNDYSWLATGQDNWFEWHREEDVNEGTDDISIVPTAYKSADWYANDYYSSWSLALNTATEAGGWSVTSNLFPTASNSDWIWSPAFEVGQTYNHESEVVTIARFNSPVFFRNTLEEDDAPSITLKPQSNSKIVVDQHENNVDVRDYFEYEDDIDSEALLTTTITATIIEGNARLNGFVLNTNEAENSKVEYTVTDSNNQTSIVIQEIKINPYQNEVIEFGSIADIAKNAINTSLETYNRLVLLAQMQTSNNIDVEANLRNNILNGNVTDLRENTYSVKTNKFSTKVEANTKDNTYVTLSEAVGYLALESGVLRNTDGEIIGQSDTIVVDYNDDLKNPNGSYDNAADKEDRDSDLEYHEVVLQDGLDKVVVFAQITSTTGSNYTHARVDDVNTTNENNEKIFKVFLEEWDTYRSTNHHNHELVSYLAVVPGKHKVYIQGDNGLEEVTVLVYDDNSAATISEGVVTFDTSLFPGDTTNDVSYDDQETKFINSPIVLSQVQDTNNDDQVWMRQQNIKYNSVDLYAQHDTTPSSENVSVIVVGHEAEYVAPQVTITGKLIYSEDTNPVTITATDDSPVKTILYSVNGSDFVDIAGASIYTIIAAEDGPVTVVAAMAIDIYGNESEPVSEEFVYDNESPDVIILPEVLRFNGDLDGTIGSTADDVAKIEFSIDGSDFVVYDNGFSIETDAEVVTDFVVTARVTDVAGNVATGTKTYTHDPTIPNINFADQSATFVSSHTVLIESSTDDDIYYIIVDEDDIDTDGPYTLYDPNNKPVLTSTKKVKAYAVSSTGVKSPVIEKVFTYKPEIIITEAIGSTVASEAVTIQYGPDIAASKGYKQLGFTTNPLPTASKYPLVAVSAPTWTIQIGLENVELDGSKVSYIDLKADKTAVVRVSIDYKDGEVTKTMYADINVTIDYVPATNGGTPTGGGTPSGGNTPSGRNTTPASTTNNDFIIIEEEENVLGLVEFYDPYIFGYPDTTFKPQNSVTRAEIATMFAKILKLNLDYPGTPNYGDVAEETWFFNYVQASTRAGLFVDEGTGNFRPNEAITRAELASVFAKFWDLKEVEVNAAPVAINDIDDSYWAATEIYKIYNAGIVSGYEDGTFRPDAPTLREHVVGMINTLIARPEFDAIASKFTDISDAHWAYGNIEAASQVFVIQQNIPVPE